MKNSKNFIFVFHFLMSGGLAAGGVHPGGWRHHGDRNHSINQSKFAAIKRVYGDTLSNSLTEDDFLEQLQWDQAEQDAYDAHAALERIDGKTIDFSFTHRLTYEFYNLRKQNGNYSREFFGGHRRRMLGLLETLVKILSQSTALTDDQRKLLLDQMNALLSQSPGNRAQGYGQGGHQQSLGNWAGPQTAPSLRRYSQVGVGPQPSQTPGSWVSASQ